MHPSLQFLDFSYLTHREKDRGHLPQKVNKNEIRHGTEAAGDCADALKHKMRCSSEDLITSGPEMAFKLQNRQITEAEMDGNTSLCIMHAVFCQRLSKTSLEVTFAIDLCSYIRRRMGNYRHPSHIKQEKSEQFCVCSSYFYNEFSSHIYLV